MNLRPATQEQGNGASQTTNAGLSSPSNLSEPLVLAHEDPPTVFGPDQYSPWQLVSRKKPNPKKKPAAPVIYFQPPTQTTFYPPTRQSPISHYIPLPNKVTEAEPSANKCKRKLVTPTNQTPKQTNKSKPKAQGPLKPSKVHSPISLSQKAKPK